VKKLKNVMTPQGGGFFDSNCTCAVKNISILLIEVIINYVRPITSIYQATSSFDLNSIDDCSCTIAAICIDAKKRLFTFLFLPRFYVFNVFTARCTLVQSAVLRSHVV